MKKLLQKLKKSNAGLSLLELLLAVVILAIVAAPLLHAFVTSANGLSKSRRYGEATTAAQNVQEAVEASTVTAVVEGSASVQALLGASAITKESDLSCLISGMGSGARSYDARVTFDASTDVNSQELIQYNNMDATFAQDCSATDNPDLRALEDFKAMNTGYSNMSSERSIEVRISRDDTDNPDLVFIKVIYSYTFNFSMPEYDSDGLPTGNVVAQTPHHYTEEYALFPHGSSYTNDLTKPLSVYIMYFPYYDMTRERIIIRNTGDIPVNLFLIKQWAVEIAGDGTPQKLSAAAVTTKEATHVTDVSQYQSTGYSGGCTLYTNAKQNLGSGSSVGMTYRIFKGGLWYNSAANTLTGELASKKAEDRYYTVTIDVYESGKSSGSPVYSLYTSKLK